MIELTADESRVLGVLIEKSTTTPDQYPLSLNAVTNGSNQKNNRDPVRTMTEDECFDALESLRGKAVVVRVDMQGSRVHKYRHQAGESLHVRTAELALLAELLLRGPQTVGELRGRAGRMAPLESLEAVQGLLTGMSERAEPLVKQIPPSPGSRAPRFVQLLCAKLHDFDASVGPSNSSVLAPATQDPSLVDRVTKLEAEVASLRGIVKRLAESLGESEPVSDDA